MQSKFEKFINENNLFEKSDKVLLALSGGVDSVVLCHLLKSGGYKFGLAHCNFKLRGKESEGDEKFCRKLAEKLKVDIHCASFDTENYSNEKGISIQMAARDLRFEWFEKLLKTHKYTRLLTAHHAGDNTETVLINLLRGTGIKGLKGIRPTNKNRVRPLLIFSKEEIISFARKNDLKFREDKSNKEDKYERNYLRLKVIPKLKKLRNDLDETFLENSKRFAEESEIVETYIHEVSKRLIKSDKKAVSINRAALEKEKFKSTLLHYLLKPYGFNETQKENLLKNISDKSISGKKYKSPSHEMVLERDAIVISSPDSNTNSAIELNSMKDLTEFFKVTQLSKPVKVEADELVLSKEQIKFPLQIRRYKTGDKFKPFGMKGFKLLSDFFKDRKFGSLEKKKCRILVNGNGEIIWLIGHRSDERYRVDERSTEIIKLKISER